MTDFISQRPKDPNSIKKSIYMKIQGNHAPIFGTTFIPLVKEVN